MDDWVIRNAVARDHDAICALNGSAVVHTSVMDAARLSLLATLSSYFKVVCVDGSVAGFLLAMGSGVPYQNDNYSWFAERYESFIYVDRIVVSAAFHGRHLGSRLYEGLFCHARDEAIAFVTCEYNIVPPNEASRMFHDRFGFKEQGTRWVAEGTKRVSLQVASVVPNH